MLSVEQLFRWSPDMEWTGRSDSLTVLQARPITTTVPDDDEKRSWYLTLRPGDARLKELRQRVAGQLIPELAAEGEALAAEQLDLLDDQQLADAIEKRSQTVAKWKKIYWDEFIPFAHGVRRLATYYNDAVQPEDPYEFVGLLRDQPLLAAQRNRAISELAQQLASRCSVRAAVEELLAKHADSLQWPTFRDELLRSRGGSGGVRPEVRRPEGAISRHHVRPGAAARPARTVAAQPRRAVAAFESTRRPMVVSPSDSASELEEKLLDAVGPERRNEAMDVIETGRVSWKLRDDDNLLVARLESQLLRALDVAANRLRELGRLTGDGHPNDSHRRAARSRASRAIDRSDHDRGRHEVAKNRHRLSTPPGETPRQLIGQPASPGVATGLVRCVFGPRRPGQVPTG